MTQQELRDLERNENCRQNYVNDRWKTENKDKYRTFLPENSKTEDIID
jgi:hypothetical protein